MKRMEVMIKIRRSSTDRKNNLFLAGLHDPNAVGMKILMAIQKIKARFLD
jgi:hypothetical protein